jgi:membrane-bound lytic murein transglycosylase B
MRPDSPEAIARVHREATEALRADPLVASRAIALARARSEIEVPALLVVAFAGSLALWLSLQGDASAADSLDEAYEAAEASL